MTVTVKLFATLRDGRFDSRSMEFPRNTTVLEVINKLKIDEKDAAIVFINSQHVEFHRVLQEGDILGIFPPVGGG